MTSQIELKGADFVMKIFNSNDCTGDDAVQEFDVSERYRDKQWWMGDALQISVRGYYGDGIDLLSDLENHSVSLLASHKNDQNVVSTVPFSCCAITELIIYEHYRRNRRLEQDDDEADTFFKIEKN